MNQNNPINIRNYAIEDREAVNAITRLAWEQFRSHFADFDEFISRVSDMAELSETCEVIVAELSSQVVGVVGYGAPHQPKIEIFDPEWAVVRMLSTHPAARGRGIGQLLVGECIRRARRDQCTTLALTTTTINTVALKMYLKMGFLLHSEGPPVADFPAGLYILNLKNEPASFTSTQVREESIKTL